MSIQLKLRAQCTIQSWYGAWYPGAEDSYADLSEPSPTPVAEPAPAPDFFGGRGLVIGRFDPLHRGHEFLVRFAQSVCSSVVVAVAARGASLPLPLRQSWLEEVFPECYIVPFDEEPLEALGTRKPIRCLFSCEDNSETRSLAASLGAQFLCLDRERLSVPVRARDVRRHPFGHWRHLPDCVRAHYALRIVVAGCDGAGKTTLSQMLAQHYQTPWVQEEARRVADLWRGQFPLAQFAEVALAQRASEDVLARQANRVLICDTDIHNLAEWARQLYQVDWEIQAPRREGIHLVLEGRPGDKERQRGEIFNAALVQRLVGLGKPYRVLRGDLESEILPQAVEIIESLLAEPGPGGSFTNFREAV